MENKCNKKSNYNQLQSLVEYMEEHPDFARGGVVYGSSKMSTEEQWVQLTKKLNSFGPPIRTIVEWKKTWADLKSRTKKKIADNNKSLRETGGGAYRMYNLTPLEQVIDKILNLNKSAAPGGSIFGYADCNKPKHNQMLKDSLRDNTVVATSPESITLVAVITPTRQQKPHASQPTSQSNLSGTQSNRTLGISTQDDWFLPLEHNIPQQPPQKRKHSETENELPSCSSAKKLKATNEQISLIRRQVRISESSAAIAKEQAEATKTLAEATKALVVAVTRMADAVELQADAAKKNAETQAKILASIDAFRAEMVNCFSTNILE